MTLIAQPERRSKEIWNASLQRQITSESCPCAVTLIRVAERFFCGHPRPHLLGASAPESFKTMSDEEHEKMLSLEVKISLCLQEHTAKKLAHGFLRYEALRKLKPSQFIELHKRNLAGERFDDMVDDLVLNFDKTNRYRDEP